MKYIVNKYLFVFLLIELFSITGIAQVKTPEPQNTVRFTENKNQWNKNVLYRAQLDAGVLFLEKNCFTYSFYDAESLRKNHVHKTDNNQEETNDSQHENTSYKKVEPIRSHAFRMTFLNAKNNVETSARQVTPDYCNFFIGKDKSKWAGNVKNYKEVNYQHLYNGIDMQVLGFQNSIKYNFFVAPGGDPQNIQLFYEGVDKIHLEKGELKLSTSLNEMLEQKPYAYQLIGNERLNVPCEFVLEKNKVSFKFPKGYNKNYELVIDPILIFAASSGSLADNFGMTATFDAQGNLYSGGTCFDQGYPTTTGAYDTTYNGNVQFGRTDIVITKYDSSGTFLHYSTYLGGAVSTEIVTSLMVNAQDELLLYGATGSSDFPVTPNAYDTTFNGGVELYFSANGTFYFNGTDIYIAKFNASGTSLLSSTFIGGNKNDGVNTNESSQLFGFKFNPLTGRFDLPVYTSPSDSLQYNYGDQYRGEINVDKFGNVFIASSTRSPDFPIVNGFDSTLGGRQDAVLFKFNEDLSELQWSTFIGGSDNDAGYALAMDKSSNIYVTGGTRSSDFPTTSGSLQTSFGGGKSDGYIIKVKGDGSGILHSTYWGTNAYDQTFLVQLDKDNDVYVVGQSESAMPVTAGVYNNPNSGQFITKMNDSLNTLIFSTVFGNGNAKPVISQYAFLVDNCENIYVSGWGGNIETNVPTFGMPLTPDAIQPTTDGFNFYLFVLSKDATALKYATYFGGPHSQEHVDGGTSRFDKNGILYQSVCAGCWGNDDFPVTPGAWPKTGADVNHSDKCNNGVFKFDFQIPLILSNFTVSNSSGCAPHTVTFENQSTDGSSFIWDFGNGDTTSTIENPTRTFSTPGTHLVKLYISKPSSCNIVDTTFQYITVYPVPDLTSTDNAITICSGDRINVPIISDIGSTYTWMAADNPSVTGETINQQSTDSINDTLFSSSPVFDQTVTYSVTPVSNANQCVGIPYLIDVSVAPRPNVRTGNSTICSGLALNKTLTSNILSTYTWLASDNLYTSGESLTPQTGNSINDTLEINSNTDQTVTYTITPTSVNNACSGTTKTITVLLHPSINTDFNFDSKPCTNKIVFHDSSAFSPVSWLWYFGDGDSSTVKNPKHTYGTKGKYDVQLISATQYGCMDTALVQVDLSSDPITISEGDIICKNDSKQLKASGGVAYRWSPSKSLNDSLISDPVATIDTTTKFTVAITTVNALGDTCVKALSTTIKVIDPLLYSIYAKADKDTLFLGQSTTLHAITDSSLSVSWSDASGPILAHKQQIAVAPINTTTYSVTIMDSTGCAKSASVTVYVIKCNPSNIFVPNTFTPNDDGKNDVLFVRGNEITELYFAVYNRWGQLVFETMDLKKGWNGIYQNMKADPAVFAWYLRAKCFDGGMIEKKGNVTLIR